MSGLRREQDVNCWLRLKRHRWVHTGAFRFGPGAFNRGPVLRCQTCKREVASATVARRKQAQ